MLDEQQDAGDREARERLVEERRLERRELRVAERPVRERDLEPPRERGRLPEQLLVEVVAPPADRLREHDAGRHAVHHDERRSLRRWVMTITAIAPPITAPQIDRPPRQIWNARNGSSSKSW